MRTKSGISNGAMTGSTLQVRVKTSPRSYGVEEQSVFFVLLRDHGKETNNHVLSKSSVDSGSSSPRDWAVHHILPDHLCSVSCLAWSLDDTILLTSAEDLIKLWNTKVNTLYRRYMSDKTFTSLDPQDWLLYSNTGWSYRLSSNRYLMATRRLRFHIWGFRPENYCLGKLKIIYTHVSAPYQISNLFLALYSCVYLSSGC